MVRLRPSRPSGPQSCFSTSMKNDAQTPLEKWKEKAVESGRTRHGISWNIRKGSPLKFGGRGCTPLLQVHSGWAYPPSTTKIITTLKVISYKYHAWLPYKKATLPFNGCPRPPSNDLQKLESFLQQANFAAELDFFATIWFDLGL